MNGFDIICNLSNLLEKGCDPNELAKKLDSSQLYECFEELVSHGLKATDEIGEKICDWQYNFMSKGYILPDYKTNYYVLDDEGFGHIHDETSLPLSYAHGYDHENLYVALITIANHIDSILECGFSKETIAEWFMDNGFDDDDYFPYDIIEDTAEYSNFLKIMSCGEKYAKHVVKFFFSSYEEPGTEFCDARNRSKFNMFIEALKTFIDAGIEKDFLVHCISDVCYRSLAYYFYRIEDDDEIWDLLGITALDVVTEDMFCDSVDEDVRARILSRIIDYYGDDGLIELSNLIIHLCGSRLLD